MLRNLIFCVIFALMCSGCSSSKKVYDPSLLLPEGMLGSVVNGQTDKGHILASLGQPTKVQHSGDRSALYTYALKNVSLSGKKRFLLFGKRQEVVRIDYFHVLLRDNIVVKHWIDEYILAVPEVLHTRVGAKQFTPAEKASSEDILPANPD